MSEHPVPARWEKVGKLAILLVLIVATIALLMLTFCNNAGAYDYTADMKRDCAGETSLAYVGVCEVVAVEPLTMAEALKRKLQYRAVGWGKLFPADEDGWFIAKSGEFIPQSWALVGTEFKRCTYPLNDYWSGPPDNVWKVRKDNSTKDGLPATRCFWRPGGK